MSEGQNVGKKVRSKKVRMLERWLEGRLEIRRLGIRRLEEG